MHFHFLPLSFKPFGAAELASVCYLSDGFTLIFNLMMPPSLVLTSLWTCYCKKLANTISFQVSTPDICLSCHGIMRETACQLIVFLSF